jgi:transposase
MDAGYCLLKGKAKVTAEFSLVFLAYNLKRVINIMGSRKLIDYITMNAVPG